MKCFKTKNELDGSSDLVKLRHSGPSQPCWSIRDCGCGRGGRDEPRRSVGRQPTGHARGGGGAPEAQGRGRGGKVPGGRGARIYLATPTHRSCFTTPCPSGRVFLPLSALQCEHRSPRTGRPPASKCPMATVLESWRAGAGVDALARRWCHFHWFLSPHASDLWMLTY